VLLSLLCDASLSGFSPLMSVARPPALDASLRAEAVSGP